MQVFRALLVICVVTLLAGCAPVFDRYYYFSVLKTDGLVVLERSTSDVGNLFFHDEMAVKYRLDRQTYSLMLEVDKDSYLPTMHLSAQGDTGGELTVVKSSAVDRSKCLSFSKFTKRTERQLKFSMGSCGISDGEESVRLAFDVLNTDGTLKANEVVELKLVSNGFYYVIDAL